MIKFYNNEKIAIISDIHFGVHSNSEMWHKIVLDYGNWLKIELDKQNIKDILILGDIFNNREEVGVNTLAVAEQFFKIFTNPVSPYNIVLLVGNHDSYLRDESTINSISIFKGWSNITVVDKIETIEVHGQKFTFIPWGGDIDTITEKSDVIFGHLEINNFKKAGSKLCENGIDSTKLFEKAFVVISGHFHLRDERIYKDGKIVYVGCPYAQSWNDVESSKGYYILNTHTLALDFFENTISPKYFKIKISEMFDKTKIDNIKKNIPNNFIKLQVDKELEFDKLEKILTGITLLKPIELSSDFTKEDKVLVNENYESVHLDTKTLLTEFINTLDISNIKDKVLKEMEEIYNRSITKVKIENE